MARLQGINYSTRPAALNSPSPQLAVQEAQSKLRLTEQVFSLGNELAQMKVNSDEIDASARTKKAVSDFEVFVAENPTATKQQLEAFGEAVLGDAGAFESIDTTEFDTRGEVQIPSHLWRSTGLAAILDASVEKNSEIIQQPAARNAWRRQAQNAGATLVSGARVDDAKNALKYELDRTVSETQAAIKTMDIEVATDLLQKDVWKHNRAAQKMLAAQVAEAQEIDVFNTMMVEGDYDGVMDMVTDTERTTALGSDKLRQVFFAAQAKENGVAIAEEKAKGDRQDYMFREAYAGLADGTLAMEDILANPHAYGEKLPQLVTLARTMEGEGGQLPSPRADAIENRYRLETHLAARGIFPEGVEDLEDYRRKAYSEIYRAGTYEGSDGQIVPGLAPSKITSILSEIDNLQPIQYTQPSYKRLVNEMRLRIMRSEESGPSFLASHDAAMMMANALDDLHSGIDDANTNGVTFDFAQWETDKMPKFMNKTARAAFLNLPPEIQNVAVFSNEGKFSVDYQATKDKLLKAKVMATERGASTKVLDLQMQVLGEYWADYGEYAK